MCSIGGGAGLQEVLFRCGETEVCPGIYADTPVCVHQPRELTTRCLGSDAVTVQCVCVEDGAWRTWTVN